jgi:hypothetical protein
LAVITAEAEILGGNGYHAGISAVEKRLFQAADVRDNRISTAT